jgi:hypothetical protein
MTTAEKIYQKARALPEPTQNALLHIVDLLTAEGRVSNSKPKPQFGSAKGLITIGPEFDEPLEDLKPYME